MSQAGSGEAFHTEIVLIDDCSTDETVQIAREALGASPSIVRSVVHVKPRSRGLKDSLEIGLDEASGQFIQIVASDDMLELDKLQKQLAWAKNNPGSHAIYSLTTVFENGKRGVTQEYAEFEKLLGTRDRKLLFNAIATQKIPLPLIQSALFRANPLRDAFFATRRLINDDWVILLHFAVQYDLGFCPDTGFLYRKHCNNTSANRDAALINQLEVVIMTLPQNIQRSALARVLQVHALHFWSIRDRANAIRYFLLSISVTGAIGSWIRYFASAAYRRLSRIRSRVAVESGKCKYTAVKR